MNWINIKEKEPNFGQNVIAIGTWHGVISGEGESEYMGIVTWNGDCIAIDSDICATEIIHVTHWMPLPKYP